MYISAISVSGSGGECSDLDLVSRLAAISCARSNFLRRVKKKVTSPTNAIELRTVAGLVNGDQARDDLIAAIKNDNGDPACGGFFVSKACSNARSCRHYSDEHRDGGGAIMSRTNRAVSANIPRAIKGFRSSRGVAARHRWQAVCRAHPWRCLPQCTSSHHRGVLIGYPRRQQ